jgi:hypothetical protein
MNETSAQRLEHSSELDEPIWAVVSFERIEASSLTYPQATEKMQELDAKNITGLCIVTVEAAARSAN